MSVLAWIVLVGCSSSEEASPRPVDVTTSCTEGFDPGDCPPDFALPDRDGDLVALSDHVGQVVLVDQSAIW